MKEVFVVLQSGGNSSAVERQPSKLGVAGSNPVSRSTVSKCRRAVQAEGGLSEVRVAPFADTRRGGLSEMRVAPLATDTRAGGLSEVPVAPHVETPREARVAVLADTPRNIGARLIDNRCAHVAQLAEHALGKGEVSGSIPDMGSRIFPPTHSAYGR